MFAFIDTPTLVLLTITVAFGLGVMSIALTFHHSGTRGTRGLRHWGRGLVVYSAGTLLLYAHPKLGQPLLYAGWLCILFSMFVMYRALLRICGNDGHRTRFGVAVVGAVVLAWIYFGLVDPDPMRQGDATLLAIAVIAGRASWDMLKYAKRSRFRAPAYTVVAWLMLTSMRPLLEVVARDSHSAIPADGLPVFGPPAMIFFRVLVLALLSISVIWLEISRLYEAVEDQATHDELTGVANRRAVVALLEQELVRASRLRTPCSIALIDIDHFKRINDTYGHPAGDQVIKWVTAMVGKSIRPYDTLGRYGGEEFLLLMPGARPEGAMTVAERARTAIEKQECMVDGKPIRVTISVGVGGSVEEIDSGTLLRAADQALYRAKQGGRNRTVLADFNR